MKNTLLWMIISKHNRFILQLLLVILFYSGTNANSGPDRLSKESLKQHEQLKSHIIKTFKEDNGDIIDCIDINKQPSLSHPLLKNHQIQLKPESAADGVLAKNSTKIYSEFYSHITECPKGYVPIKRTSEEDLKTIEYLRNSTAFRPTASPSPNYFDAMLEYRNKNHGGKGSITVWNLPNVVNDQSSSSSIIVLDGAPNEIDGVMAGWMVYPQVFKDHQTRLFTYWNASGASSVGCYNTFCPGYVQVDSRIRPGIPLRPVSVIEGKKYFIEVQIILDNKFGHWFLIVDGITVGYWPKTLFKNIQNGANYIAWGGQVNTPSTEPSAPMGSGMNPNLLSSKGDIIKKVAYIRKAKVYQDGNYSDPTGASTVLNGFVCYGIKYYISKNIYWAHNIYFGGPGGCGK